MKNRGTFILLAVTALFVVFTVGFFLGRNVPHRVQPVQNSTETQVQTESAQPAQETQAPEPSTAAQHELVNINTATVLELSTLPGVGQVIGQRIVDYRKENGPFADVTQLLQVEGIGEKRMEELLPLITVGG